MLRSLIQDDYCLSKYLEYRIDKEDVEREGGVRIEEMQREQHLSKDQDSKSTYQWTIPIFTAIKTSNLTC
jgi:hypothetical protein